MITSATNVSPQLRSLLRDVLRDERGRPGVIDPRALARRIHLERGDCAPSDTATRAAERELLRVHRCELAYLLRVAAAIRGSKEPHARTLSLQSWRACLSEQLDCIALDTVRVSRELTRLLARCVHSAVEHWPSAVELARASLALHDIEAGRIVLGAALLDAGHAREAAEVLAAALERTVHGANFEHLLDGLVEAQRRLGFRARAEQLTVCAARVGREVAS